MCLTDAAFLHGETQVALTPRLGVDRLRTPVLSQEPPCPSLVWA